VLAWFQYIKNTTVKDSKPLTLDLMETVGRYYYYYYYYSQKGLLWSKRVVQINMKWIKVGEKTFHLQTLFCSCFVRNLSKEATDLARIGRKFPWGAKLEAYMVPPHYPNTLLLDRSPNIGPLYLVGNLTSSKIGETKALEPLKYQPYCISIQQFSNLLISQRDMSGPRLGALSNNRWSGVRTCTSIANLDELDRCSTW
jgi:hypothetical protein